LENYAVLFGTNADTFLRNSAAYLPNYEKPHSVHFSRYIYCSKTLKSYKQRGFLDMSIVQEFASKNSTSFRDKTHCVFYKSANISEEHASIIMETEHSSETSVKF